uniref:Peptidoglycan hydrolase n=1 Tax=Candidatus Kentrum sp. FW TaxID=2126338 RepID=A0A450SSU0_9GAMM|nr:MAG: peptidoglycan hydrolase [Candidatus Kentron sp. FW]
MSKLRLFQRFPYLRKPLFLFSAVVLGCQLVIHPSMASSSQRSSSDLPPTCLGKAEESNDGHRRLALIVGVGKYKKEEMNLQGPPNDARNIYELLTRETGEGGYGFPKENICMLLDGQATTEGFKNAFEQGLIDRVQSKEDVALFFYAGHGSQVRDCNGDEPDEWDETFVFHDARSGGVKDFTDDEFNGLLARLHKKTRNITVILDSCNSGTGTRGGDIVERKQPPGDQLTCPAGTEETGGDGGGEWLPEAFPGVVILTAASDGTSAIERKYKGEKGDDVFRGVFTDALITALGRVDNDPLTYAKIARQIPPKVLAKSQQIPYFHGDLGKPVFGNTGRTQPLGWDVTGVNGKKLTISGPTLPGFGPGAELRVYDDTATGADTNDPAKLKAAIVIDSFNGINADARITGTIPGNGAVEVGDLAVLARVSNEELKISVRLRPSGERNGIPERTREQLKEAIEKDREAAMLVTLTEGSAEFEVASDIDGKPVLLGPEDTVRKTFKHYREIPKNLWQHARQKALKLLEGEGGYDFDDNETLKVKIVSAKKQKSCAHGKSLPPPILDKNGVPEQIIPLCHSWHVEVTLDKDSPAPLLIGGLILSTDGSVYGFPADGREVRIRPGETKTFDEGRRETFVGQPPLDVQDRVMVFGSQEKNPVKWHLLADTERKRSAEGIHSGLNSVLHRYLQAGNTRGIGTDDGPYDPTSWTLSTVNIRIEANSRFLRPEPDSGDIDPREYTIANFDINPYLPDDDGAALHKVLQVAHGLYKRNNVNDGVPYKQHPWKEPTEEKNLKVGIDCSRSIWYAFTRAGLPYNQGNEYLHTARMFGSGSKMNEEFESCENDPNLRIGDVLVYRDEGHRDGPAGHTVMVIDPEKRIAWGSHGWDGNGNIGKGFRKSDTGVEYQKIKPHRAWKRWDTNAMQRVACWRHRAFIDEAKTRGQAGVKALKDVCKCK